MTVMICHTRPDGTIVTGTARGDGSAAILKAAGFRWAPSLGAWIIAQSRDRAAKTWKINAAADGLRGAGFEVQVSIDETPRAFTDAETERADRAETRAERYSARAQRAMHASTAAYQAARQELDYIPMGQPILVGHHSERGHRAALKRIDNRMRRSLEEAKKAEHYTHAATGAQQYTQRREALDTTLRRIGRLEAEQRRIDRELAPCTGSGVDVQPAGAPRMLDCPRCWTSHTIGEDAVFPEHGAANGNYRTRLLAQRQQNADEIAYWQRVVADKQAAGAKVWSRADFAKGDLVLACGGWREVLRVNAKSVTVSTGYSWTDTIPYDKVRGRRSAQEDQL